MFISESIDPGLKFLQTGLQGLLVTPSIINRADNLYCRWVDSKTPNLVWKEEHPVPLAPEITIFSPNMGPEDLYERLVLLAEEAEVRWIFWRTKPIYNPPYHSTTSFVMLRIDP
jgi:hypothetical protein